MECSTIMWWECIIPVFVVKYCIIVNMCTHIWERNQLIDKPLTIFGVPPITATSGTALLVPLIDDVFRAPADPPPFFHSPSSYLSWNCQTKKWVKNQFEGRRRWVDPPTIFTYLIFFKYIFSHIKLPKIFFRNCWRHQIPNKHKNNDASWGVRGHWKI
jgi:hypothetical protein